MSDTAFWFLGQISSMIVVLPLILSLFIFKRFNGTQKRILLLLIATFIAELIAHVLWARSIHNSGVYHVYTVVEFLLIIQIFRKALLSIYPSIVFRILEIAFIVCAVFNTLYFQGFESFNSNMITISGTIVILLSLTYFYRLLQDQKYQQLDRKPLFWCSSGLLIYFSSNFVLFYIRENNAFNIDNHNLLWGLHSIVNIVLIIFYTIALWIQPEEK